MGLTDEPGKRCRYMLYIRPTAKGYEAYDIYHNLVFTEKNCDLLFSFLESTTFLINPQVFVQVVGPADAHHFHA